MRRTIEEGVSLSFPPQLPVAPKILCWCVLQNTLLQHLTAKMVTATVSHGQLSLFDEVAVEGGDNTGQLGIGRSKRS